ncbi:MAG TPA: ATP-binding protein [Candidatus Acidoferrum sp.]|nr:ATP-binding protein [Candidatus Acidoferrum sp.]
MGIQVGTAAAARVEDRQHAAPPALVSVVQPRVLVGGNDEKRRRRFPNVSAWLGSRRPSTFVALLAIATMGPLALLSTLSVNSVYSTLTAASQQRLTDSNALAAVYVATQMKALTTLEDSYAHRLSLVAALKDGNHLNYDGPAILTNLQDLRSVQPDTKFAAIIDPAGFFWLNQDPAQPQSSYGKTAITKDWYIGVTRVGKAYVSSAYLSGSAGAPLVIAIADPIWADGRYAPKGTRIGVLVVGYDMTAAQSLFSGLARTQGVQMEVTDQKGVTIAQSGSIPTTIVYDKSAGVASALAGRSSFGRVAIQGRDSFTAYSPVAGIGWTVVTSLPAAVALADANRLRSLVVVITIVLLAILALAKAILYVVSRDRQDAQAALAGSNLRLEQRVTARTAELESSNRDLEAFSYSVSHDLRSPLRSIDGFSRMVLEENEGRLAPDSVRKLGIITAGAQQMGMLIDDLLSFSRLGRVELKKRRVFTDGVVAEVIAELKQENPGRQIDFVVQDLPACHADPILIRQVFRNLLGNAVKFSRQRPVARIEVGTVPAASPAGHTVTFFVKDNGAGFDMRYVDKLFGVFQRLHRMEDFPGTGVGLALVRRIVERHGGKVWAEAAVDAGATFYLTLEDASART